MECVLLVRMGQRDGEKWQSDKISSKISVQSNNQQTTDVPCWTNLLLYYSCPKYVLFLTNIFTYILLNSTSSCPTKVTGFIYKMWPLIKQILLLPLTDRKKCLEPTA